MGCDQERAIALALPNQLQHLSAIAPLLCAGNHGVVHLGRPRSNHTPGPSASTNTCPLAGVPPGRKPYPGCAGSVTADHGLGRRGTGVHVTDYTLARLAFQRRHEPITPLAPAPISPCLAVWSGLPTQALWGAPPRQGMLVIKPEVHCPPSCAVHSVGAPRQNWAQLYY